MATETLLLKTQAKSVKTTFQQHGLVATKQLRSFGFIMATFFALVLGFWPFLFKHGDIRIWPLWVASAFLLFSLLFPLGLKPLYQLWMLIGGVLGWINTRIILSAIFFLIFTPIGIVLRLLGKDTLGLRYDSKATTYRTDLKGKKDVQMKMQF